MKIIPKIQEKMGAHLIGEPPIFLVENNQIFCVKDVSEGLKTPCEDCPHISSCQNEPAKVQLSAVPPSRKAIAIENESFLVLQPREGVSVAEIPEHLKNQSLDHLCLDERNLHFLLNDFSKPYQVLKGQIRYYDTEEAFLLTEYPQFFTIHSKYVPSHHIVALDYKSQEPRVSTIVSREPVWVQAFIGEPQELVHLINPGVSPTPKISQIIQGSIS